MTIRPWKDIKRTLFIEAKGAAFIIGVIWLFITALVGGIAWSIFIKEGGSYIEPDSLTFLRYSWYFWGLFFMGLWVRNVVWKE